LPKCFEALWRAAFFILRFSAHLCFFVLRARQFKSRFSAGQIKDASALGSFFELEPHKLDLIYSKTRFLPQTGSPE